ncbi:MAG: DUF2442 domain-containing protein [Cytophagales bacterium]
MKMTNENSKSRILAVKVWFEAERVCMEMNDGRIVAAPLVWFPRLANATEAERNHWELTAHGYGVHWPDVDEDLLAEGMFTYSPQKELVNA